jgi:glucan biosynthesis protein C
MPPSPPRRLRPRLLILCAGVIATASFVLRIPFHIDSYQLGAAHVWQWGQCIGLFVLGVIAGRQGWLTQIPRGVRRASIGFALAGALLTVAVLVVFRADLDPFGGGWHWQSLVIAVIEGVVGVSATIVLVDLFRAVRPGQFSTMLIRAAYGAYLVQTPVLVGIALALRHMPAAGGVKLLITLPVGLALSFATALILLRIPALRRVL